MIFPEKLDLIPDRYKDPVDTAKGRVERVMYRTKGTGEKMYEKYCAVYLPANYDTSRCYDIAYLLHGAGDTCERCFDKNGETTWKKYMFDNMILYKEARPFIVAAVEWYPHNEVPEDTNYAEHADWNEEFWRELREDIMPVVEKRYHTYADFDVSEESLKNSRDHRAMLGWSMGSVTTWFTFAKNLDVIRFYNNESCDCWLAGRMGGKEKPEETARLLAEAVKAQNKTAKDFVLFMMTGSDDFASQSMGPQAEAMKAYGDPFLFEGEDANCCYLVWESANHHTWWRRMYQYNALKAFFPAEKEGE